MKTEQLFLQLTPTGLITVRGRISGSSSTTSVMDTSTSLVYLVHSGLDKFLTKMVVRWSLMVSGCTGGHFTLAQNLGLKIVSPHTHKGTKHLLNTK